jgi:hypothetical protein
MSGFKSMLNEASWDRIVRVVLGIVLLFAGFTGVVAGTLGILVAVIGGVLLATAFAGFCPIYAVLGTKTKRA